MFIIKNVYNKFDIYILLLVFSTAFGSVGGALSVARALGIMLAPKLCNVVNKEGLPYISSLKNWIRLFYLYALVSIVWTPDVTEGIKELVYYAVHFLIFFELIVFSKKAFNPLRFITIGFLLCVFSTSVVAFWELLTDNHLSYSMLDSATATNMGGEILLRKFAAVTFYNFNGYVTHLCLCVPYLLYGILSGDKLINKLSVITLIEAVILVLSNASRGGLLSIIISLAIYFLISPKNKTFIYSSIVFLIGFFYILSKYGDSVLLYLSYKVADGGLSTDESRFEIWSNALRVLWEYGGLGCGIGGMNVAMEKYAKGGVTITHNIFMEILCQYGIVFCLAFIIFLFKQFRKGWDLMDMKRRMLVSVALVSFPMTCIIDSGYLLSPQSFVVLASLYVFANYERIRPVY